MPRGRPKKQNIEETLKIFRLTNGDDVVSVCKIYHDDNYVELINPMLVAILPHASHKKQSLVMTNWLPSSLIDENACTISMNDILLTMDPNPVFAEYYSGIIMEQMQSPNDSYDASDEELDLEEAMEERELLSPEMIQ